MHNQKNRKQNEKEFLSVIPEAMPDLDDQQSIPLRETAFLTLRKLILTGGLPILGEVMPNATIMGFTDADEAVEYARANRVALAFLDIELRNTSGLDLCRELLKINPRTNVVFLTAYSEYALDAWGTGASGFMLKPITSEGVREQLKNLRYPFWTGGEGV